MRTTVPLGGIAVAMAALMAACGAEIEPATGELLREDASVPEAGGPCETCLTSRCAAAERQCAAEPECEKWAGCFVAACSADAGCDPRACPSPAGTAAGRAAENLKRCQDEARTSCAGCPALRSTHPLLDDVCSGADDFLRVDRATCLRPPDETAGRVRCRACVVSRCCESRRDCERDASCKSILECTYCDENAFSGCLGASPQGVPRYAEYRACVDVKCSRDCLDDPTTLDPCVACWNDRCADDYVNWQARPEAAVASACSFDCQGDEPCRNKCNEVADALPEFGRFLLCQQARCRDVCGF